MSYTLTLRRIKGASITYSELDANFLYVLQSTLGVYTMEGGNVHSMDESGYSAYDAGPDIQTVLTAAGTAFASSGSWSVTGRQGVMVYVDAQRYQLKTAITVPAGVILWVDGSFTNNMTSATDPCVIFSQGSHCKRLNLNANGKGGVQFGTDGQTNDMRIDEVAVYGANTASPAYAVQFKGKTFDLGSIDARGGFIGVDFSNAVGVNFNRIISTSAVTGASANAAESINGELVVSSSASMGLNLTSVHKSAINMTVFNDDDIQTVVAAGAAHVALNITGSGGNYCEGLRLAARVGNSGGDALAVGFAQKCRVSLDVSNSKLNTGNANPTLVGVAYGTNLGDLAIDGYIDLNVATQYTGTMTGTFLVSDGTKVVGSSTVAVRSYSVPDLGPSATDSYDIGANYAAFSRAGAVLNLVKIASTDGPYTVQIVEVDASTSAETVVYQTPSVSGNFIDQLPATLLKVDPANGCRLKTTSNKGSGTLSGVVVTLAATGF